MRKRRNRIISLLCAAVMLAGAAVIPAEATEAIEYTTLAEVPMIEGTLPVWEDGDVVGFIGDSITHAEYCAISYVEVLYDYYLSHYPEKEVEFRNLGVASFKASHILDIYHRDQAFEGINKAVIMLGMNEALRKDTLETYITNMEKIISLLKEDGLTGEDIIVLSPTPYDETCNANFDSKGNMLKACNGALTEFTRALSVKTQEWGVYFLDLHTPMQKITEEIQKESKNRTLTDWDCIHPDALGQQLMAYYILQAQGADPVISEISISEEGEARTKEVEVTNLYRGEGGLCWDAKFETLPMAITPEWLDFNEQLFDLTEALCQTPLQIEGLETETSYHILMGGSLLGTFSGQELAEGINLAELETNPLEAAIQQAELVNRDWHLKSANYRRIVRYSTMAVPTHTEAQRQEAYDLWVEEDAPLRNMMYAIVQEAVEKTYRMIVVEEGYSIEKLEKQAERAAREKQKETENLEDEAEEKPEQESGGFWKSFFKEVLIVIGAAAGVFVLVLGAAVVISKIRRRRKRGRRRK